MFHRHRWIPVSVQTGEVTYNFLGGGGPVTLVLKRCDVCERTRTEQLDGHWTLEQIKGGKK